ncbi:MAG: RHS repeat-associated core domain-containing protein [Sphingobacterium sp.]|jgi:RHS repeat-associated protein|nr:RHS repeat-associated core domain-containing protein [Sphingobacterium sp.]
MRKIFILFSLIIGHFPVFAQTVTKDQNHLAVQRPRREYLAGSNLSKKAVDSVNLNVQYFDGLGRPSQTIDWSGSPMKNDIVQYIEYDGFGRKNIQYLPHVKNTVKDGSFKSTAKTDQLAYYAETSTWDNIARTKNPYSITVFENSPLNRVKEQGAPGAAWQPLPVPGKGHTVKTDYGTNTATGLDIVKLWIVTANGASGTTNYTAGKLYRTTVWDENMVDTTARSGSVDEYKDFEGRVVLKRVWENESKALNTYYVYDDFGDLRYVVPPAVTGKSFSEVATDTSYVTFNNYIYSYKYDGQRRLVEKKIPGKGLEYLIYNENDQVVLTQDAEQRIRKEWTYSRYDAFGRVTSSGLYTNKVKVTRADVSGLVDAATGPLWETRSGADYPAPATTFPLAGTDITIKPHIVNYYDDYMFADAATLPPSAITKSTMIKSLQTGSKVYKTDGTSPLLTVMYYDDYGRVIQSASKNHLEGTDYVTNTYTFPGELLTSTRVHTPKTGAATTIITTNEYDHVGRLTATKERIVGQGEVVLASNSYNEIGQLKSKAVGKAGTETTFVNTSTYTYNERGWLSKSTSPKFSQQLKYQDGTNPQWNGNISQQLWGDDATLPNTFSYTYDKLNRLLSGTNGQTGTASIAEVMSYDNMGNIKTLKRDALAVTTYAYTGNKLTGFTSGLSGSYTYDANGNAKTDRMGMAFTYNYLNLPQTAKKAGTDVAFLYDAAGQKLQKVSKIGTAPSIITTKRDYVAGIEYNNGVIDIIQNSVGYAQKNGTGYVYHYNLTDHLGNVRATLKRGSSATAVDVVQRDNYYPFGKRKVVAGGNNKYLYNGKEIQGELGDQYDYGARFYDAEIGRWNVVDPKAEVNRRWSPYRYAYDNPIRFIDPDGMLEDDYYSKLNGQYLGSDGAPSQYQRLIDDKEFRSISRENGGSQSLFGTAELHKNSQVVKIDNEKIQGDLQGVRDNSITSNVEHQINIVLDRESATITSTIGDPGTNNRSVITYYPAPATGVNFETPGGNIIIGQAHGHPASNEPGKTTLQTMSVGDNLDSGTSAKMGIPIYGVDAMSGKVGSSGGIHRVTPDGKITNNIGKTIGNGTAKGAGALNIGRQALEIWGKKK